MNVQALWILWVLAAMGASASADPETGVLSLKERRAARKIYVAKCAKCHRFHDPQRYDSDVWKRWMNSMSEESKLKPAQRDLLERFLEEYRAGKLEGKPQDKL